MAMCDCSGREQLPVQRMREARRPSLIDQVRWHKLNAELLSVQEVFESGAFPPTACLNLGQYRLIQRSKSVVCRSMPQDHKATATAGLRAVRKAGGMV
jgi:hypothetical protein